MVVRVHVTAFGAFEGVAANPTVAIIKRLVQENALQSKQAETLDVDAKLCAAWCSKQTRDDDMPSVYIHLGVKQSATSPQLELEACARNCADFPVPDNANYQPTNERIDDAFEHDAILRTRLDVDEMCKSLSAKGYQAKVSQDAGRYVCNYTYWHSLNACRTNPLHHALFIHVPDTNVMPVSDTTAAVCEVIALACASVEAKLPSCLCDRF